VRAIMEIFFRPEPSDEERRAVELALRSEEDWPAENVTRWRRSGLEPDGDEPYATARPRSRPGAMRA
jgi:hypothetical protein